MTKYGIKRACIAIAVLFAVNIAVITLAQRADAASYKRGSTGSVVSEIQQKLKDWGYYSADVDGVYGSRTEEAVLLFQSRHGDEPVDLVTSADRADRQAPLLRIAVRPVRSIFLAFFGSIRIIIL